MTSLDSQSFKFGYNGKWFNKRKSVYDAFEVHYEKCLRQPFDFRTECIENAKAIARSTDLPIWVLYSGGADSEVVVRSFMAANIKFNVAIVRFAGGLNEHDTHYATELCDREKLCYQFFDIDIEEFFSSKQAFSYAEMAVCASPIMLYHFWAIDQIDGYPILGYGEPRFLKRDKADPSSIWDSVDEEVDSAAIRFLLARERAGCGSYFQYSSELMLSYLQDDLVIKMIDNKLDGVSNSDDIKLDFYKQHFDMQDTPQHGFHGFEAVEDLIYDFYPILYQRYRNSSYFIRESLLRGTLTPGLCNIGEPQGKEWTGFCAEELFFDLPKI
ncbi:hypothetical protein COB52_03680 [Candidatus Kaiserbacteria bacterium]|nr:MAG: hypothetical protein COB52_03680 [Candidatus Kaiserbacteria bacterium]